MKYKVFRSYKEAASAPEGSASLDWALKVIQASPEVTAVECRVPSDKRLRVALGTWLVEVSTQGICVPVRPKDGEVGFTGETGRIAFMGAPVEMYQLVKAALARYTAQAQAEAYLNG